MLPTFLPRLASPFLACCLLTLCLPAAQAAGPAPVIKQESVSAVVGQSFSYQVRASNAPTSYFASGLPDGLGLDPATGIIGGTPTTAGFFTVSVQAANADASTTDDIQMAVFLRPVPVVTIAFEKDASVDGDGIKTSGSFLLTRTGGDIADEVKVTYSVAGGAQGGVDYVALKGKANVQGNKGAKHLKVAPIDRGTGPGKKAVKVTLQPGIGYILGEQTSAKLKVLTTE